MVTKPVFKPEFFQDLAENNPLGLDTLTEQDARDWFDSKWLEMREFYSRRNTGKPNWKLRAAKWWGNLREDDLCRARERGLATRRARTAAASRDLVESLSQLDFDILPADYEIPPMKGGR